MVCNTNDDRTIDMTVGTVLTKLSCGAGAAVNAFKTSKTSSSSACHAPTLTLREVEPRGGTTTRLLCVWNVTSLLFSRENVTLVTFSITTVTTVVSSR